MLEKAVFNFTFLIGQGEGDIFHNMGQLEHDSHGDPSCSEKAKVSYEDDPPGIGEDEEGKSYESEKVDELKSDE
jgi:hypothetical protein